MNNNDSQKNQIKSTFSTNTNFDNQLNDRKKKKLTILIVIFCILAIDIVLFLIYYHNRNVKISETGSPQNVIQNNTDALEYKVKQETWGDNSYGTTLNYISTSDKEPTKRVRVDTWGGKPELALLNYAYAPFENDTGIRVLTGTITDLEDLLAAVMKSFPPGGEYNILHLSSLDAYIQFVQNGLGVELDEQHIPNIQNIMPAMLEPLRKVNNGKLSAIPYDLGQTGIAYNPKYITKEKAEAMGVGLLWDSGLAGKIGSYNDMKTNVWYAALYTGQDPNNIENIDGIWQALAEQHNLVQSYWETGYEFKNLWTNEKVYVSLAWSGQVQDMIESGYSIAWLAPDNAYTWMEYMFVLKGTDLEAAETLLNYMLNPEPAIEVALSQNYPPSLDPTKIDMPDTVKSIPAYDPTGSLKGYLFPDPAYWIAHIEEWSTKWKNIITD